MAGLKESRPSPPRGGKHKDVSQGVGAIGALLGGTGDATLGADMEDGGDLEAGEGSSYGNRTSAPTTSQPNYASLLTKPNVWNNILSRGGASIGYNNALAGLAGQQIAGQNALDVQGLRGTQQQNLAVTQGEQARQTARQTAVDAWMTAHDLQPTTENILAANDALFNPTLTAEVAAKKGQQLRTDLTNNALQDPTMQANVTAGERAKASAPVFINQRESQMRAGPLDTATSFGDVTSKPNILSGAVPGGTSVSDRYVKDPSTGFPVKTTTSTPSFLNPKLSYDTSAQTGGINLSDLATKLASGGGDDNTDSYDEGVDRQPLTPTPQVSAKPPLFDFSKLSSLLPSNNYQDTFSGGYTPPKQTPEQVGASVLQQAKDTQSGKPAFGIEDFLRALQQLKGQAPSLQQ